VLFCPPYDGLSLGMPLLLLCLASPLLDMEAGFEVGRRSLEHFLLNYHIRKVARRIPWTRQGVRKILGAPVRRRIGKNRNTFPWELWVSRAIEKVVARRSLLALLERSAESVLIGRGKN
jgi:hypothetical protein